MKVTLGNLSLPAVAVGLALSLAGCGLLSHPAPKAAAPAPAPPTTGGPHVLTNLNSLAPENHVNKTLVPSAAAEKVVSSEPSAKSEGSLQAAGAVRYVGNDKRPGEERLLNVKAARFASTSNQVLHQLYFAMQALEQQAPINRLHLRSDLKPVIVTGILSKKGRLKELIIDQHSGETEVDNMVVEACKQGLYMHSPPPAALTPGGNYKVQVHASISSFASSNHKTWRFTTKVGIALL